MHGFQNWRPKMVTLLKNLETKFFSLNQWKETNAKSIKKMKEIKMPN